MSITWNGVSSDTIGVIVERIPNRYVPTRRFSPQQVAGRNGNILLVDKAFPNVEQEYEVYLSAEAQGLPSVARACAEWLMGPDGYCRLQDSYDTTVYREAFLMGGYDLENILNKFGRCTITFSCKPQKYLLTGDTPIEIPAGITTYTGDVVQFDGVTGASITSLSTTITPTQDLHGYSSPWPAGGGKNKFITTLQTTSAYGTTFTVNADGSITVSGTPTELARVSMRSGSFVDTSSVCVFSTGVSMPIGTRVFCVRNHEGAVTYPTISNTHIFTVGDTYSNMLLEIGTNYDGDPFTLYPMIEDGSTATAWTPYSNICPISGRTGLSVYRTGKNLVDIAIAAGDSNTTVEMPKPISEDITVSAKTNDLVVSESVWRVAVKYKDGTTKYVGDAGFLGGEFPKTFAATSANPIVAVETRSTRITSGSYDICINVGNDTAYEPYNGTTYAVDWTSQAGTVYGGTLDVVTGVLTVDKANIASYNGEVINEPWLSSMDEYAPGATPTTGAQVVYELATPLTYQLTPQEVEALVGTNNVWTSSGPVSVTVEAPFVGTVTNPTPFEARPLLEVSGVGEITINGKTIQILEAVSDFNIDCESMEAEDNSKIYCIDFPELSGGENEIAGDGSITALTVTPRWWTL